MIRKLKYLLPSLLILLLFNNANARLTINITQGVSKQVPIRILEFSGPKLVNDQVPDGVSTVIADDLKNSGRFSVNQQTPANKVIPTEQLDWSDIDANYVVLVSIKQASAASYNVQYQLISKLNNQVLSAREFDNIQVDQFRVLAHTISNYIYQAVTGSSGYFTSKLAYIDVQNPYDASKSIYRLILSDYDGFNPHTLLQQTKEPIMSPTWSKDGQNIAYVSYYKGGMAIYIINIYTAVPKKVANYIGINSSPSFSPSGNTLAMALSQGYSENTNIYLMNLKNDKLYKKLSTNGINTAPTFSPSGKELAFVSNRGGQPQIYTLPVDSSTMTAQRLTFNLKQAFDPQYTHNGQDIVFMYKGYDTLGTQIAKINLQTNKVTVLTDGIQDSSPSISPDGNMVIYSQGHENGDANLAMVSIDGKVKITLPSNSKGSVQSPSWSPAI